MAGRAVSEEQAFGFMFLYNNDAADIEEVKNWCAQQNVTNCKMTKVRLGVTEECKNKLSEIQETNGRVLSTDSVWGDGNACETTMHNANPKFEDGEIPPDFILSPDAIGSGFVDKGNQTEYGWFERSVTVKVDEGHYTFNPDSCDYLVGLTIPDHSFDASLVGTTTTGPRDYPVPTYTGDLSIYTSKLEDCMRPLLDAHRTRNPKVEYVSSLPDSDPETVSYTRMHDIYVMAVTGIYSDSN